MVYLMTQKTKTKTKTKQKQKNTILQIFAENMLIIKYFRQQFQEKAISC